MDIECKSCINPERPVFVFGSNLAGRHGKGAAFHAGKEHGARYGEGWGRTGHSYAIPTKDDSLKRLNLAEIAPHVAWFREYAKRHDHEKFFVTRVGCGLAGYRDEDMAPLFKDMPDNVWLPETWVEILTRPTVVVKDEPSKKGVVMGPTDPDLGDPELWYC